MTQEIEGNWDIVIASLQDICNSNESLSFNNTHDATNFSTLPPDELIKLQQDIIDHKSNIGTAKRLIDTSQQNLMAIIEQLQKRAAAQQAAAVAAAAASKKSEQVSNKRATRTGTPSKTSSAREGGGGGRSKNTRKVGRSFWTSKYNPSGPVIVGSEVAYKLKNRHSEEWIQCEVVKVISEMKFEIRDPEPDENNNPGQTFRAGYKEILLIPPERNNERDDDEDEDDEDEDDDEVEEGGLVNYVYGTKVLARYPETTTFYPAVVVGNKKDGKIVRLKFDGEEEVNKETEVERRLVLPFPEK
ncbi:uncharacterized protein J8A68_003156 [[Candida] subhashii]|uniref:SGF29 C-terminal domain-containing protein n=1 Tax=[Candida] subhashii TaxID=561895 RepID=A0A8J5QJU9_9ASCO|nr:uncharacterized protein J8A68_003156 [[Candida] subhashii]KAG7663324.1 hypothetical protein J8A68_003156 [[Candida] subhashii]